MFLQHGECIWCATCSKEPSTVLSPAPSVVPGALPAVLRPHHPKLELLRCCLAQGGVLSLNNPSPQQDSGRGS